MNLHQLVDKIRSIINKPRQQYALRRVPSCWYQVCSSLDVLEDTELVLEAYDSLPEAADVAEGYLRLYGLLQALFTQQDAADHLCERLGVFDVHESTKNWPRLQHIRDIRNDSVGHPTKRQDSSFHFISRATISKRSYQLLSYYKNKPPGFSHISVPDLIGDQRKCLSELLQKVVATLQVKEQAHSEEFRTQSLVALFPHTWPYSISKLFELTTDPSAPRPQLADLGLREIISILDSFKNQLEARGTPVEALPGIQEVYKELEYPFEKLRSYIDDKMLSKAPSLDDQAAYIFVFFINAKIYELIGMANEIDEGYAAAHKGSEANNP